MIYLPLASTSALNAGFWAACKAFICCKANISGNMFGFDDTSSKILGFLVSWDLRILLWKRKRKLDSSWAMSICEVPALTKTYDLKNWKSRIRKNTYHPLVGFEPMIHHFGISIQNKFSNLKENYIGGAGYRSRYLSHAKRALYHLSYAPLHV